MRVGMQAKGQRKDVNGIIWPSQNISAFNFIN